MNSGFLGTSNDELSTSDVLKNFQIFVRSLHELEDYFSIFVFKFLRTSAVESSSFEAPKKPKFNFYFIETGEGKGMDWAVLTAK